MDPQDLCMGCMEERNGASTCASCGYVEGTAPASPVYMAPRTVLREQYMVGRVVGHGGFGITYIGWDLELARKIAVKEYFPSGVAMRTHGSTDVAPYSGNLSQDYEWGLERYLDEARVVARFHNHPNIVWVQQFFRANGTAYMVLEFLDGATFEQYIHRQGGKVPWDTALSIMMPVMDALREVHRTGILHRDISPDNVYILRSGQIKLIDFGAARHALGQASKNLSIILKEGYAPEEQYRSKGNQGPWTDVYATAATLYRAVTGKIPPPALDRQRLDELERPSTLGVSIPEVQERALLQGLAVNAEQRFQDVTVMQKALAEAGDRPAIVPPPVPPPPPPPPPPQLPKWLLIVAGVVGLLVTGVAVKLARTPILSEIHHEQKEDKKVDPPPASAHIDFRADTTQIRPGQAALISWNVQDASEVSINGQRVPAEGRSTVRPQSTVSFKLVARGLDGAVRESSLRVEVVSGGGDRVEQKPVRAPAQVVRFTADPAVAQPGSPVTISWEVTGARRVFITPAPGSVASSGSSVIIARMNNRYVLTAQGDDGRVVTSMLDIAVAGGGSSQPPVRQPSGWAVGHDHQGGILGATGNAYQWAHCEGTLSLSNGRVRYQANNPSHSFDVALSDVVEVKTNRIPIRGYKAFHIRLRNGENYNFVSRNASAEIVASLSRRAN